MEFADDHAQGRRRLEHADARLRAAVALPRRLARAQRRVLRPRPRQRLARATPRSSGPGRETTRSASRSSPSCDRPMQRTTRIVGCPGGRPGRGRRSRSSAQQPVVTPGGILPVLETYLESLRQQSGIPGMSAAVVQGRRDRLGEGLRLRQPRDARARHARHAVSRRRRQRDARGGAAAAVRRAAAARPRRSVRAATGSRRPNRTRRCAACSRTPRPAASGSRSSTARSASRSSRR